MTNTTSIDFSDLEDASFWDNSKPRTFTPVESDAAKDLTLGSGKSIATIARYTCDACQGTKVKWYGYRPETRRAYPCPKCKGVGMLKTSPEARQAAKQSREDAKVRASQEWAKAFPDVATWIEEKKGKFGFAISMHNALVQYGSLTDGQIAAIRKCIDKDKEFMAAKAARVADAQVQGAGFTRVLVAFAAAKESKLKYPKLHIGNLVFSLASETSKNAGSIYVKDNGLYLGKINKDGGFFKSSDCNEENTKQVETIAKDPLAAIIAHGKETGICACCGRELENEESVQLGIGPICRRKWGLG